MSHNLNLYAFCKRDGEFVSNLLFRKKVARNLGSNLRSSLHYRGCFPEEWGLSLKNRMERGRGGTLSQWWLMWMSESLEGVCLKEFFDWFWAVGFGVRFLLGWSLMVWVSQYRAIFRSFGQWSSFLPFGKYLNMVGSGGKKKSRIPSKQSIICSSFSAYFS